MAMIKLPSRHGRLALDPKTGVTLWQNVAIDGGPTGDTVLGSTHSGSEYLLDCSFDKAFQLINQELSNGKA